MSSTISTGLFTSNGTINTSNVSSSTVNASTFNATGPVTITDQSGSFFTNVTNQLNTIQNSIYSNGGLKVFICGFLESNIIWDYAVDLLKKTYGFADTQTLRLCPPGFGGVPWPAGYTPTRRNLALWIKDQLQTYINRGIPIDVVGHDFGAIGAVSLEILYPNIFRSLIVDIQGLDTFLPSPPFKPLCLGIGPFQALFAVTGVPGAPVDASAGAAALVPVLQNQALVKQLLKLAGMPQYQIDSVYTNTIVGKEAINAITASTLLNDNTSVVPSPLQAQALGANGVRNLLLVGYDADPNPCGFLNNYPNPAGFPGIGQYVVDAFGNKRDPIADLSGNPNLTYDGSNAFLLYAGTTNNVTGINTRDLGTIGTIATVDLINLLGGEADCVVIQGGLHEWMSQNPTLAVSLMTNHWKMFA
jgi:hypothetical protein